MLTFNTGAEATATVLVSFEERYTSETSTVPASTMQAVAEAADTPATRIVSALGVSSPRLTGRAVRSRQVVARGKGPRTAAYRLRPYPAQKELLRGADPIPCPALFGGPAGPISHGEPRILCGGHSRRGGVSPVLFARLEWESTTRGKEVPVGLINAPIVSSRTR